MEIEPQVIESMGSEKYLYFEVASEQAAHLDSLGDMTGEEGGNVVDLTELLPVVDEIRHVRRHLRRWMKPQRAAPSLTTLGTRARIVCQPRGRCLIIGPWNYPVSTLIGPLVSAVARKRRASAGRISARATRHRTASPTSSEFDSVPMPKNSTNSGKNMVSGTANMPDSTATCGNMDTPSTTPHCPRAGSTLANGMATSACSCGRP